MAAPTMAELKNTITELSGRITDLQNEITELKAKEFKNKKDLCQAVLGKLVVPGFNWAEFKSNPEQILTALFGE